MSQIRNRRFSVRLPFRLVFTAQLGRRMMSCQTSDIGLEGLFLTMDRPPSPLHLVHLTTALPEKNDKIMLRGMVVRTVTAVEGELRGMAPGAGIQFYGTGNRTRMQWQDFVRRQSSVKSNVDGHANTSHDKTSRRMTKPPPHLYRITPSSREEMERILTDALMPRAVVLTGLSTAGENKLAVVSVSHPNTLAEFHVPGELVQSRQYSDSAVFYFVGVSRRTIEGFRHFIDNGTPPPVATETESRVREKIIYERSSEVPNKGWEKAPWISSVHEYQSAQDTGKIE